MTSVFVPEIDFIRQFLFSKKTNVDGPCTFWNSVNCEISQDISCRILFQEIHEMNSKNLGRIATKLRIDCQTSRFLNKNMKI